MNKIITNGKPLVPGKVICVGRNFVEHIAELQNEIPESLVVFMKPNSAITDNLLSHHRDEELHYEGEISFLVENGRFAAVAFGLDLTKRGIQSRLKEKGLPWERAKSFDCSALFSDFVPFHCDFSDLSLELKINGKLIQHGSSEQMIHKPETILKEVQQFITLNDGDIIMTGTPKGVGLIQNGDNFTGEILANGLSLVKKNWIAR